MRKLSLSSVGHDHSYQMIAAQQFSFEQLASIYNDARVDYIIPMPMNAHSMAEYARAYDVDLSASVVIADQYGTTGGIGMLGIRQDRGWVTRLGIVPASRGQKLGQRMMEALFANAAERGIRQMQLEVIEGNKPAHHLFLKIGFRETCRLLVIRRPPSAAKPLNVDILVTPLDLEAITQCLAVRDASAGSWMNETPSLLNAGKLEGLRLTFPNGAEGWIIFRNSMFQITHVVLGASDDQIAQALLQAMHSYYPRHDTKVENLRADSPHWRIFQSCGYGESFSRVEMVCPL